MRAIALVFCVVLLGPAAAAHAADTVLPPPTAKFVPGRGGKSAGASCSGKVRCVGPSAAYKTIAAAVAAAKSGDSIQVQAGTYRERVVVNGKELKLLGGFAAGFKTRNPAANRTVIDGQGGGTTVFLSSARNSTVDGFTVTGGRAPLDQDNNARGSGIRAEESGAVTIRNNLVEGNDDGQDFNSCNCSSLGGGIDVSSSLPRASARVSGNIVRNNGSIRGAAMAIGVNAVIDGNLVENNRGGGDHGGGLYLGAPRITVRQNLIRNNSIGGQAGYGWGGGAIFFGPGDPTPHATFEANRWVGNRAPSIGSALFVDEDAAITVVGDLFYDNACGTGGGAALYVDGTGVPPTGSTATLENVTMTGHRCKPDIRGSAIFTEGGSSIAVRNSIITGNGGASQVFVCTDCAELPKPPQSTIAYSLIGAGGAVNAARGAGMLSGAPGFARPASKDFHLANGSNAIDAADPASKFGREPRPNGGRRNMGAYGGSVEATKSSR
jgi:Right handed beta helix region